MIRDLTAKGVSIVYISHHLEEALQISDHAVVLRDGVMTAYAPRSEIDLNWIVRNMVGDNYDLGSPPTGYEKGGVALSIENLSVSAAGGGYSVVDRVTLECARRRDRLHLRPYGRGPDGDDGVRRGSAAAFRRSSSAERPGRLPTEHCAADCQRAGPRARGQAARRARADHDCRPKSLPRQHWRFHPTNFYFAKARVRSDQSRHTDVHIKTEGGNAMIGSLSGGNQQKVVIGKMLATNPTVVLLDEPSRGIDIGAKSEVFKLLAEGARRGLAVVYSTSEVGECLSVAHRIVVMARGKISAEFGPGVTKEKIMAASGEVDLEYQLSNAYGLNFCHVVADLEDETPLNALGAAGAAFLGREIGQGTKRLVGVGYGRTLKALVDVLPEQANSNLQLVSLMGSLTRRSSANPHEVIDRLAHRTGAQAFVMPVPFMANTAADRSVLLEQQAVAEAFALAGECDLMLVGIGATDGGASLVSGGMIEPADMDAIRRLGAVGEVLGHFFDIGGRAVETELSRRIVTLPVDRLRNRRIVAVAGGAAKVEAIRAVLASGLLNGLLTDESTARAIVEASEGLSGQPDKRTAA